jgi:hypothetical protein
MVKVSDIVEYPTELGAKCKLLNVKGLSTYHDTEEALLGALEGSARDSACLNICMESSHCSAFFQAYTQGVTPFTEKEPIKLNEFNGRYWAAEGKHRICAAKRYGVKEVEAQIYPLDNDWYTRIAEIGQPGRYRFSHTFLEMSGVHGEIAILWAKPPKEYAPRAFSSFDALRLDEDMDTHGEMLDIFPGLSYSVSCRAQRHGVIIKRSSVSVEAEVMIDPIVCQTKIWLMKGPAQIIRYGGCVTAETLDTLFRIGLWRNYHLCHNVNGAAKRTRS